MSTASEVLMSHCNCSPKRKKELIGDGQVFRPQPHQPAHYFTHLICGKFGQPVDRIPLMQGGFAALAQRIHQGFDGRWCRADCSRRLRKLAS